MALVMCVVLRTSSAQLGIPVSGSHLEVALLSLWLLSHRELCSVAPITPTIREVNSLEDMWQWNKIAALAHGQRL